jgi:Rod binding domain-containing protein
VDRSLPAADSPQREEHLRHVAQEFEAVLTAAMLKEGLKSANECGLGEKDEGSGTYMDIASEQMAYFIGRQGVLGIADRIVDSLRLQGDGTRHADS